MGLSISILMSTIRTFFSVAMGNYIPTPLVYTPTVLHGVKCILHEAKKARSSVFVFFFFF